MLIEKQKLSKELEKLTKDLNISSNLLNNKLIGGTKTKMKSEIDMKKNPIQANPANPNNPNQQVDSKNVPKDKEADEDKKLLVKEVEKLEKQIEGVIPGKPDGTGPKAGTQACPLSDEEKKESISVKEYLGQKKEFMHQSGQVLSEGRTYVKDPSQVPPGVSVKQGSHGGYYYDSDGGAGAGAGAAPKKPVQPHRPEDQHEEPSKPEGGDSGAPYEGGKPSGGGEDFLTKDYMALGDDVDAYEEFENDINAAGFTQKKITKDGGSMYKNPKTGQVFRQGPRWDDKEFVDEETWEPTEPKWNRKY